MHTSFLGIPRLQPPPAGQRTTVTVGSMRIAVFEVGESVLAVEDACVRCAEPLAGGVVDGVVVTCPHCGWSYDLRTGASIRVSELRLNTFPVHVEHTRYLIEWPCD